MIDIEVLKLTLAKEEDAIRVYKGLLINHPNVKELLSLLVTEEQKHKALIEKKIAELMHY
ncbi:MAG: hypothetical protein ABSE81_06325 [Candidatus Omnitrophota bacterium]|jgi:rubrerythrin